MAQFECLCGHIIRDQTDVLPYKGTFLPDEDDEVSFTETVPPYRTLLNTAYAMVEDLEKERAALVVSSIDRDKERTEYERVLEWCKKVKSEREELSYSEKRDFLRMIGVYVLIDRLKQRGAEPTWDIKVALPAIQEIIYQGSIYTIGQLENNNRKTHSLK